MSKKQQNQQELTPWNYDQLQPRNIIIEFQNSTKLKKQNKVEEVHKKSKFISNLDRFIDRKKLRIHERFLAKILSPKSKIKNYGSQKLSKPMIQGQSKFLHETFQLSQKFPSFSLNKIQRDVIYKKPHRLNICKTQMKNDQSPKNSQQKSISKTFNQKHISELTKNLTEKKISLEIIEKPYRKQEVRSCANKQQTKMREKVQFREINENKYDFFMKSNKKKSLQFQEIISFLQKQQKQKSKIKLRSNKSQISLDGCLKPKKPFYLNLPKIQFIQIQHQI